ncbi:MAG: carboxypeptidase regulatory-like domain-containing protein [Vicinamibacterales bacterium]
MRSRSALLSAALIAALSTSTSYAQQQSGEIFGRAVDTLSAALAGVTVTIEGPTLLTPRFAITSENGAYRVPELPIGTYLVRFELSGFRPVERPEVRVTIGFRALVNATMELSPVAEALTVEGETPLLDTKSTGTKSSFDLETLQTLPSARDPWALLEKTPAIVMDRVNVGGSQSGEQSEFVSRGAGTAANKWSIDGVDITDMSAPGTSPLYYDFDMFQEIQVTTSGADVTQQTSGVMVNLVTRSGTDVFKGSGRVYATDERFESDNVTDEMRRAGAGSGAPIQNIKDLGFEIGGPIKVGKAWYWGSYGKQQVEAGVVGFYKNTPDCRPTPPTGTQALRDCLETDLTELNNYNWKVQWALTANSQVGLQNTWGEKVRNARDASDTRPLETTNRQKAADSIYGAYGWSTGPQPLLKSSYQRVLNDRWLAEVLWSHLGNNFTFDFHTDDLSTIQPRLETTTGVYGRSYQQSIFLRPTNSLDLTTTYFQPSMFGGDHSLKAGVRWRTANSTTLVHWGGNAVARYSNGVANSADLYRDGSSVTHLDTLAVYLQDSYAAHGLTVSAGFRVDAQTDEARAARVPASPLAPLLLPAIDFPGADAGVTWKDVSPRLGLTYDFSGQGRTLVNASFATYYGQLAAGQLSGELSTTDAVFVRYPWADLNGDGFVQLNEVNTTGLPLDRSAAYDPNNPGNFRSPGLVDPGIHNERTREFVVGFDRELRQGVTLGGSYVWRAYDRFNWRDRVNFTSADYRAVRYTPTVCPSGARCETITYFEPIKAVPPAFVRANRPDFFRKYSGLELTLRKRYSKRWTGGVSYAFNSTVQHYDSIHSYEDPTNIELLDGAQYAPESTAAGLDGVFMNAKWVFRGYGAYTLPLYDISVSGTFNTRQGFPFPQSVLSPDRSNSAGTIQALLDPVGEVRLRPLRYVDLRVDKARRVGPLEFVGSVEVFNVGNINTILARRRNQEAANANGISMIVAPRIVRFGLRVAW